MRGLARFAAGCYALGLRCYPRAFQAEFGAEMQAVFCDTLECQAWPEMLDSCWREIRDWPRSLWREHLRVRKGVDMNPNYKQPTWLFYLGWVVLSTLAIHLALGGTFLILKAITNWIGDYITVNGQQLITEDYLFMFVYLPLFCLLTGFFQAFLLRPYFPKIMGGWIGVTALGWLAVVLSIQLVGVLFQSGAFFNLGLILGFAWVGMLIGFFQWLWLRRHLSQAGWWIFASLLGWALAALGATYTPIKNGSVLAQVVLTGFFPALVTGLAWWYLFKPKSPTEPTENKAFA